MSPFSEVTRLTEVEEGTLVRCLQRLDERLRQLRGAARILGDPALAAKLETATAQTRRDVVVTASLYTQ
ncbi:hypothetical protein AV530_006887 [Patagioenas fasciata monilis]|uniref:ATP-dependent RNA helicase Ski2/MTR4 C-terminal domain-containing protein n=1 Tax=Patagioenas fasciata monilis TaxID=372326 RepID=A0A1V4J7S0_PATFA|nr:hypothetical protein AV530_006887 [Patagioenas fasciata monilis]